MLPPPVLPPYRNHQFPRFCLFQKEEATSGLWVCGPSGLNGAGKKTGLDGGAVQHQPETEGVASLL